MCKLSLHIYIYIYPFWRALYRIDNLVKIPLTRELFFLFIFGEEGYIGVYSPLFWQIYMILPSYAGKIIYIFIYDFARAGGQKRIYIIYMGSRRAIYSYIAPRPRIWFVLGLRPRTNQILGLGAI